MKIAGIILIAVVLFVAAVIAKNRKAEAERKERLKYVFDDHKEAAQFRTASKPDPKPAPAKTDMRTPDEMENEEKIKAISAAWQASRTKEDQEYFNRRMDQAKEKYLK